MPTVKLSLSEKQLEFVSSKARFRGFIAGRGAGKSYAAAADLITKAKPGRSYLVVAPTAALLNDGMKVALLALGERLGVIRRMGGQPTVITLINNAKIVLRTGRNPDLLRGGSYSGAVLDEAALLNPITKDIVLAVLREGGESGWMTYSSTPKGKFNWLFSEIATGRPNTHMTRAHSADNPFVDPAQVDSLIQSYDEYFRKQEVEGEFVEDNEELQVLPTAWIDQAMQRHKSIQEFGRLDAIGVDTARGGSSRFTMAFRHGPHIARIVARPGQAVSTSQLGASLILNQVGDNREVLVFIDISGGTGTGVFDLLPPTMKARAVNFGARSDSVDHSGRLRFANQRARMYWSIREAIDPANPFQTALPMNYELAAELAATHWTMNGSGAIQLEPKEQISKMLRRSPDLADAVALAMKAG